MRRALLALVLLVLPTSVWAQNPVTITKIGPSTQIGSTLPISGTVTSNQGTSGSQGWLVQGLVANDAVYSGNPLPTGCYASASAPSDVSNDGDMARMWCLRNGALSVNLTNSTVAVTQSGAPWSVSGSGTFTVSGTVAATQSGTWTVQPGNTANSTAWLVTGTGGTFPVTQSTSPWVVAGGGSAGTAASGVVTIQGIGSMTPVQVSQATAASLNATVVGTGTFATQATLSAGSAIVGKVGIDQTTPGTTNAVSATNWPTTVSTNTGLTGASSPRVTEVQSTAVLLNGLTNGATTIVASAGTLTAVYCYNPNTVVSYVQLLDATSPTVGSTTPKLSFGIPALQAAFVPLRAAFGTAIKAAATTTATNGTAPSTALDCNATYE